MCSHRRRCALLALLLFVIGGTLLVAAPARAADLFVEVNPSTVQAGQTVDVRGSCNDNRMPATVESAAFGMVTLQPRNGVLAGTAMVPADTRSDTYRVVLTCPEGRTASTRLMVVSAGVPSRGPAAGFGGGLGEDAGTWLLTGGLAAVVAGAVLAVSAQRRRNSAAGRGR